jgi:hypothetical protein
VDHSPAQPYDEKPGTTSASPPTISISTDHCRVRKVLGDLSEVEVEVLYTQNHHTGE